MLSGRTEEKTEHWLHPGALGVDRQPLCIGHSKCIINMVANGPLSLLLVHKHTRTHTAGWLTDAFGQKECSWRRCTHACCCCCCCCPFLCFVRLCICRRAWQRPPPLECAGPLSCVAKGLLHDFPSTTVPSSECSVLSQSHWQSPNLWRASFSSISFPSPSEGSLRPKLLPLIFYDSCLQVIGQMVHRLQ